MLFPLPLRPTFSKENKLINILLEHVTFVGPNQYCFTEQYVAFQLFRLDKCISVGKEYSETKKEFFCHNKMLFLFLIPNPDPNFSLFSSLPIQNKGRNLCVLLTTATTSFGCIDRSTCLRTCTCWNRKKSQF